MCGWHCFMNGLLGGLLYSLRVSVYLIEKQYHNAENHSLPPPSPLALPMPQPPATYLLSARKLLSNCFAYRNALAIILQFIPYSIFTTASGLFLERFLIYVFIQIDLLVSGLVCEWVSR